MRSYLGYPVNISTSKYQSFCIHKDYHPPRAENSSAYSKAKSTRVTHRNLYFVNCSIHV